MSPKPKSTIQKITAYQPGKSQESALLAHREREPKTWVKLSSNENPFGCPVSPIELAEALQMGALYPDQKSHRLKDKLAQKYSLDKDMFVLGNGSDDILQLLSLGYCGEGDELLTSHTTFSVYTHVGHLVGANIVQVPLKNFAYDLDAMLQKVTDRTRLIMIANPNNPTGTSKSNEELLRFLQQLPNHCLCVIDEAYVEFSDHPSMVSCLLNYPNMIVTRTFSKLYGLAAFRIGYGIMNVEIASVLEKIRQPFNVNRVALEAAALALEKHAYISKSCTNNKEQKQWLFDNMVSLGLRPVPSDANFLCIDLGRDSAPVVEALLEKGILVRGLTSFGWNTAIRVTIGTPEQNELFVKYVKEIL
jgi:histidinol-phosphate aminotransferase